MTTPTPFDNDISIDELRKRWLTRYIKAQGPVDTKIRTALIQAGDTAHERLMSEMTKKTFSASVKSAQLRLVLTEIKETLHELFGDVKPIILEGQKNAAGYAIDAFTETDRRWLEAAFSASVGNGSKSAIRKAVSGFISGQRVSAMSGVVNTLSRIDKSHQPLSVAVYKSERLANNWVGVQVNSGLARNASAKDIANDVRKSIRPNTPGGVSYAAMRLGRTEVNNAFHATAIATAQDRPWVEGMRWNLSATHDDKIKCVCQRFADQIFSVGSVPMKPHPQCRCFVTPEVEAWDSFLHHLTAGQYRSWINEAA